MSSYTSPYPLCSEKEESDEVVSQLVLNRNPSRLIPAVEPEVTVLPISILSSENEHSDDFAHVPLWLVSGAKIVYLFR